MRKAAGISARRCVLEFWDDSSSKKGVLSSAASLLLQHTQAWRAVCYRIMQRLMHVYMNWGIFGVPWVWVDEAIIDRILRCRKQLSQH